jgi:hypothetical protein
MLIQAHNHSVIGLSFRFFQHTLCSIKLSVYPSQSITLLLHILLIPIEIVSDPSLDTIHLDLHRVFVHQRTQLF